MNLGKAIEIVKEFVKISKLDYLPDIRDAIKLLIEAGKHIQECRLADHMIAEDYLPGETED